MNLRQASILGTVVLVTAPLLFLSARPVYLAEIMIANSAAQSVQVLSTGRLAQVGGSGVASVDLEIVLRAPYPSALRLELRPNAEAIWYEQGSSDPNYEGLVRFVARYGSENSPLYQTERYTMRLLDPAGSVVWQAESVAVVRAIAGGDRFLVAAIGLIASALQIAAFVLPGSTRH